MTRTVERNRLKEQRRLAIKMRRAAETNNAPKWNRLVREAMRLGYLTEAQAADLASQKEYLGAHMPTQQALTLYGRQELRVTVEPLHLITGEIFRDGYGPEATVMILDDPHDPANAGRGGPNHFDEPVRS